VIDLHLHSTCSDGTLTPAELVEMAYANGLNAIALTDHDTVAGIAPARAAARNSPLVVIAGVELSVRNSPYYLHLLGYDFDWHNPTLLAALKTVQDARHTRNLEIFKKLQGLGITISSAEISSPSPENLIGRPHIARWLVANKIVSTIDEAFKKYLKKGARAYVSRFCYTAQEAISMIHEAGGLAVLAHPLQVSRDPATLEKLIGELKASGLDGLETYYPGQMGTWLAFLHSLVARYHLLETGGSDYHGAIRPGTRMAGGAHLVIPDTLLDLLIKR
jgi:predicted metal-dependent phosphoesterase TrpH